MESGKRKPGRKNNVKSNPRQAANYNEYSDENFEDFEETPEKIPRFDETDHIDNTHHLGNIKTENADFEFDESQDLGDTHDESNSYQLPNDPSTDLQNNFLRLFDFKVPESNDGNVNVECFKNFVDIVKNSFNSFYIEYQRQQIEIDQLKRHLFINQKPNEPKTFIYNGQDLMTIFAKDPKKYALCIAKIIFTEEELEKCLVTNVPDKSLPQTSRVPLPGDKMKIFTEAIMKRFDLNDSSFGEWWPKIKESINACGRHKKAKKKKQTVDINESQNITNMFDQNINNF
ncbi:unnamed protein product [Brachionus calyciflorus]|uniref:BEN domain-containing protein n=1 Tax=Brachionus calyciflorus TaxID=104777 RepID=A0A814FVQ7_9BILA|nr:unnamed protein product [Brachionus calyciflorus]